MGAGREGHTATFVQKTDAGYLRLSTATGLLFTALTGDKKSLAALNGIDVNQYVGVSKIYSPQFAVLPGFITILNIINGSAEDAEITVRLHTADGGVAATLKQLVPHGGQLKGDLLALFDEIGDLRNSSGWIEVESSNDQVLGTVTFTDTDGGFASTFELRGKGETSFIFPTIGQNDSYTTGIALLNPNDATATVTLELWGPGGTVDRSVTFTLAPRSNSSRYLDSYFAGLEPRDAGNIRVRSNQPLWGLALISDRKLSFASAVPAIPMP